MIQAAVCTHTLGIPCLHLSSPLLSTAKYADCFDCKHPSQLLSATVAIQQRPGHSSIVGRRSASLNFLLCRLQRVVQTLVPGVLPGLQTSRRMLLALSNLTTDLHKALGNRLAALLKPNKVVHGFKLSHGLRGLF